MSTTLSVIKDEQGLVSEVTKEESGFLASDNPLEVYRMLYPTSKNPEDSVKSYMLRALAPYVKNIHGGSLDDKIQESGLSKADVDILCISLIEFEHEFNKEAQKMYDESDYLNAKFIADDPYDLSNKSLYRNMQISYNKLDIPRDIF
jgi:hypothetical protein